MARIKPFTRTPEIDCLCDLIAMRDFNPTAFYKKYSSHPNFDKKKTKNNTSRDISYYVRAAAKIHLINSLESEANENQELRVIFNNQQYPSDFQKYQYSYDNLGSLHVVVPTKSEEHPIKFEYTRIFSVDGIPVVLDVKLANWKNGDGAIRHFISSANTKMKLKPIRSFIRNTTGSDGLGYAVAIYQDSIPYADRSPLAAEFRERNGILLPIKYTRVEFIKLVNDTVHTYHLKVKT